MNPTPFSVISDEETEYTHQSRLFKELRLLMNHKPPENAPPSVHDEYHLRLQEIYVEIISRFPQFAVENKLELDMWNNLYKTQIDALRSTLLRRGTISETALTVGGQPRSTMELKLRFVLLLDRASGVYLALVHRLLHSLPDTTWPKSILAAVTSPAAPTGLFKFDQLGRTSGRFDLDLVTFSALQRFNTSLDVTTVGSNVSVISPTYSRWLAQKLKAEATTGTAPRILSRGDRLPAVVQCHAEDNLKSSSAQRGISGEPASPVNHVVSASGHSNTMEDTKTKSELAESPPVDHMTAVNYIIQHCLLHLGDVARYRQPANVATGYYLWAWLVHPDSGHPYNQLAILESAKGSKTRVDALFYYFVRAIACRYPFPAALTNLRRFLRTNLSLDRLHRINNTISPSDNSFRYMLYTFLACLQLSADPSVLTTVAYKFVTISSHCVDQFPTSVDYQWLLRLVTVHVYLLTECANTLQTELSRSADTSENSSNKNCEVGCSLLLPVTVHLFDWIARQYMAWSSTSDHKRQSDPGLLAALVVILLWLRRHALASSAVLDAAFRVHAPSLSELSVCLMNNLLTQFSERSCDEHSASAAHTFAEQRHKDDLLSSQLDWQSLLQLPELALLQGFLPLGVPCQRTLCTTGTKLTTSPPFTFIRSRLETFHGCDLTAPDRNQVSCSDQHVSVAECHPHTCSSAIHRTRVQLILESARIIADLLPALIGWSDDPPDEPHSVHLNQCLRGRFQHVHRYQPTISQLIPTFSPKSTRTVSAVMEAHQMSKDSMIPGAPLNIQNSSNESRSITVSPKDYTGVPLENTSEPPSVSSAIPADSSSDWLTSAVNQCSTDSVPTDSRTSAQSPISSTRNVISRSSVPHEMQLETCSNLSSTSISVSSSANVFSSGPTSGGLIVNAELAKFIQEQASQVAARQQQQRVELSAGLAEAGDTKTPTNRYFDSSFADSGYLKGGRSNSSRLCLSAAFRKDLPPRFARRLQAELLEREQRLGTSGNSEQVDPLKSPILVDLTKPAPLARKESEAPFELDSLLSASITSKTLDQATLVPTSIAVTATSCSQFLLPVDRQLSFAPVISNPLMTRYQNASLNVTAGPIPSSTGLSLCPTSTFSLPPPLPLVPPDYSSMVSSLMHASSAGLAPRAPFTENNWHNLESIHGKNHTPVAQPGFQMCPPTSFMLPSYTTVPSSNDTLHAVMSADSFRGPIFANAEHQSAGMMNSQLYASLIERDHARAALYKDMSVSSALTSVNTNSVSEENTTDGTSDDMYANSRSGSLASFLSAGNSMQSFNHPNVP
ncbi:hypothetical protein PHET_02604 [Paragonimus heterotremus]|uniref:DNA/RNA-binding domain-containing protein n=1 Tax=Paragonimus heterotremus TaxID=100268 RepID=A0A8J4SS40_9TREM|nr:hypothetical protein PHET_02604 [Paragonimus heterotremus]